MTTPYTSNPQLTISQYDPDSPRGRFLNLGGGVQSSTVLHMIIDGDLPRITAAIFADTQGEPAAVYTHLACLQSRADAAGIPVWQVTAGDLGDNVLQAIKSRTFANHVGQPPFHVVNPGTDDVGGQLWRKCTTDYKIVPIERAIRAFYGVGKGQRMPKGLTVEQVYGISVDEAHRMRTPTKAWQRMDYPLVTLRMSRRDCIAWLNRRGYPIPPKSACWFCPYTSNQRWRQMAEVKSEEWTKALAYDTAIRRGIPGVTGEAYLHRRCLPLAEAVRFDMHPEQEAFAFMDECAGVCGV